jgi:hypothetical protein
MTQPPTPLTPLERAAAWTVEAAAAALLWAGEDTSGVLTYMAAADPAMMAFTRRMYYEAMTAQTLPNMTELALRVLITLDDVEVAALPASAAPQWARSVGEAWQTSRRQLKAVLFDEVSQDLANLNRELLKFYALSACKFWGHEKLQIDSIGALASAVLGAEPPSFEPN